MIVINRINLLRKERDWTQKQLGDKLGLSKSVIGAYETEVRKPSFEVLESMSKLFNCSIDYIMGISNVRNELVKDIDINLINIGLSKSKDLTEEQEKRIKEKLEDFAKFLVSEEKNKKK